MAVIFINNISKKNVKSRVTEDGRKFAVVSFKYKGCDASFSVMPGLVYMPQRDNGIRNVLLGEENHPRNISIKTVNGWKTLKLTNKTIKKIWNESGKEFK